MTKVVLWFMPSGKGRCFYTDAIPLGTLGRLRINRATSVEFNDASQEWEVRGMNAVGLFHSPSRQACLDWEQERFNR